MLKTLILCSVMLFTYHPDTTPLNIKVLRQEVLAAIEKPKLTDSLYTKLEQVSPKPPIVLGYVAMLEALKAKHAWNPYNKFSYLGKSKKTFQKAVQADPHNMEIRFMRFSVEHFLPSYLGYSKNLQQDKLVILEQLKKPSEDKEYAKSVVKFLLESKRCTPAEIKELKSKMKSLS